MIKIEVNGIPAPGGSKNGFALKKNGQYTGRVAMTDAGGKKNKTWRQDVANAARLALAETGAKQFAQGVPLVMHVDFFMPRPKNHFRANGELKEWAPKYHTGKPDGLKLRRSTEDALNGVIWHDDAQIVSGAERKLYATTTGALITIEEIGDG